MKKFVALLLAMLLVLANVAALAAELPDLSNKVENLTQQGAADSTTTPHFVKKYDTNVTGIVPTETLTFTITPDAKNPDNTTIHLVSENNAANTVDVSAVSTTIDVIVPKADATHFTKPGEYVYTIKETAGSSQGTATYDTTTPITVKVYVIYDTTSTETTKPLKVLGTNVYTKIEGEGTAATKKDEITNKYEVGNLTVSKQIEGNLADANMEFTMEVVLTPASGKTVNSDITITGDGTVKASEDAEESITTIDKNWNSAKTVYLTVKGGQSVTFTNIPAGVTYTVTETKAYNSETMSAKKTIKDIGSDNASQIADANTPEAYTITRTYSDDAKKEIARGDTDTVTINNYKGVEIPTGISLDTVPYIMIMAIALIGVALVVRKREEY